jgi:5-methylcytosine-specific restriction endonuclease McrA
MMCTVVEVLVVRQKTRRSDSRCVRTSFENRRRRNVWPEMSFTGQVERYVGIRTRILRKNVLEESAKGSRDVGVSSTMVVVSTTVQY